MINGSRILLNLKYLQFVSSGKLFLVRLIKTNISLLSLAYDIAVVINYHALKTCLKLRLSHDLFRLICLKT